jgi:hypothetical protein
MSYRNIVFVVLSGVAGCHYSPGGVGGGPTDGLDDAGTASSDGGTTDGATAATDGTIAPAPALQAGSYAASSTGLFSNTCQDGMTGNALPGGATWTVSVVSPGVLNVAISKSDPTMVLTWNGKAYVGQLVETGMPEYGCTLKDTVTLMITPSNDSHADGHAKEDLSADPGTCSDVEPVLPCSTDHQVTLTKM